jgi:Ca2+-dependent lipid-binding protein
MQLSKCYHILHILQDLKNADLLGKSDPYLRIYMLPGRHMELKTKTKSNTLNPIYNETFSFTVNSGGHKETSSILADQ